jgi:hypothetical protein
LTKKINILVDRAAPIQEEIDAIATQLIEKATKAKKAKETEVKATFRSKILLECHRTSGKVFNTSIRE